MICITVPFWRRMSSRIFFSCLMWRKMPRPTTDLSSLSGLIVSFVTIYVPSPITHLKCYQLSCPGGILGILTLALRFLTWEVHMMNLLGLHGDVQWFIAKAPGLNSIENGAVLFASHSVFNVISYARQCRRQIYLDYQSRSFRDC